MFPPKRNSQTPIRNDGRSLRLCALICLLLLGFQFAPSQTADKAQQIAQLEITKPIERELSGSQTHSYHIALVEGQFANVVVEQRGIDLIAQLVGADGKSIADFDIEIRNQGEEKIELAAETSGNYRLLIKPKYPKLPAGSYQIRWVELRDSTERDRLLQQSRRFQSESKRLSDAGKYAEALPLAEKALEFRERVWRTEDPDLYQPLLNLAVINFLKGEYAKAQAFCQRALTVAENALGPEHPLVARLLYNLAVFYITGGDNARAEPLLRRALPIQEEALGPEHAHVAHTLNRLGVLARNKGDFVSAELLYQRALMISEKVLGEEHDDVANALNTLAGLYREKGDYFKAWPLYERALSIYEKNRGSDHPFLAAPLHNLANLYRDMGEFDKAEQFYQRAISIREKAVGPDHADVAGSRAGLALLLYLRGDYARAKPLYLSAVTTLEKALGPNHPLVAWHLSHLAKLYSALGDDTEAGSLLRRALGIYETAYGANSYYLGDILIDLARKSAVEGKHAQAVALQTRANAILEYHVHLNLATGSERQKLAYLARLPEQLDQVISLHVRFAGDDGVARTLAATTVLQRKGRVQDALSDSLASLRARFSAEDQTSLLQLNAVTSRLARLVLNEPQSSPAEHLKQIKSLEEQREKLENEISIRSAGSYQKGSPTTLVAVQRAIPNDAALIEFAVYRPFDARISDRIKAYGEPRYVAYVIRNQGEIRWAELGAAKEIESAIDAFRKALRDPRRTDVRPLARALDEKLMRPVRALVGNATHLLVSPDGQLNLIPFQALVDEQGRYLVERYSFSYLTSGRDLLRMQIARQSNNSPVIIADPVFGDPPLLAERTGENGSSTPAAQRARIDFSKIFFGPLPGVNDEVRALRTLLPQATFLTKAKATKGALKGVVAPSILHIATHGFFLPDKATAKTENIASAKIGARVGRFAENPLLRSGLALAGANLPGSTDDNGIFTALEASGLNLWGTKLVVLSACDTGTGEVRNGEGVYGLRRALVLAGTQSQLMSLWQVADRSTRDLMIGYYKGLVQGRGRGEALRQVQLQMLQNKFHRHPYYWAGFIQLGEWGNLEGKR